MFIYFVAVYLIGSVLSIFVGRARVGIGLFGTLSLKTLLVSPGWMLASITAFVAWPVVLIAWFVRGWPGTEWELLELTDGVARVRRA